MLDGVFCVHLNFWPSMVSSRLIASCVALYIVYGLSQKCILTLFFGGVGAMVGGSEP